MLFKAACMSGASWQAGVSLLPPCLPAPGFGLVSQRALLQGVQDSLPRATKDAASTPADSCDSHRNSHSPVALIVVSGSQTPLQH